MLPVATTKHRRNGVRRLPSRMRVGNATAFVSEEYRSQQPVPGTVMPSEAELRRALGSIPEDLNWDWARIRLTPLFERADAGGIDGDPALHVVTSLGVAVGFGIDVGLTFARVTRSMANRWEASLEQIEAAAFRHLDDAVRNITRADLQHAVHRGHMMRCLPEPGGWASSVILAGADAVMRIFGPQDRIFTVPSRNMLLSFEVSVPDQAIFDVTASLEELDPHPLMLDPFRLIGGRLTWDGVVPDIQDESVR